MGLHSLAEQPQKDDLLVFLRKPLEILYRRVNGNGGFMIGSDESRR
jgi:hypothetical protein